MLASGLKPETDSDKEWAERDRKMNEGSVLTGGVGLLHTQHAQGGAAGQFRMSFTTEYMSAGFLCSNEYPCLRSDGTTFRQDSTDHIGGRLNLSVNVLKWLEPYLATSAFANSNAANRPALLQVLGDSTLGLKAYGSLGNVFHLGGAFELWLVNGTGAVGLDGGGTSAKFRALATADLRGIEKKPIPLRFSLNTTYVVDNSGSVVQDVEKSRGQSITRIERFGLNINRVDHFDIHLGAEVFVAQEKVRPFIEYRVAVPVNRQDYLCKPNNPSRDKCLANEPVGPSSLTIGGRFFPWKKGFNALLAVDIGTTGTSTFIEEVAPTPPWMLYIGAGWAFDTWDRPPVIKETVVEKPVAAPKPPGRRIRGFVHEEGKPEGIANAIVSWDNRPELTSLVSGNDGRFTTHELPEGTYVFGVKAEGYKPGQCTTTIVRPASAPPAWQTRPAASPAPAAKPAATPAPRGRRQTPPAPTPEPSVGPTGAPPPAPGLPPSQPPSSSSTLPPSTPPGAPPSQPPAQPMAPGGDVQVDCALVALPRVGTIVGRVRDAETQNVVTATIKLTDSQKKDLSGSSDSITGQFRFEQVAPGEAQVVVDADGYLAFTDKIDVKARTENNADILLKKRPKNANVQVSKTEIIIKQQVQFAIDSAVILPESSGLLSEIADAMIKNPRIKRVEVQGHTDNTGTPDHNMKLSEDRSSAVVTWLTQHGVPSDRLQAKGYGQSKPLVPNVTAANRTKNRRVQFIITDQDAPEPSGPKPGPKPLPKPQPK